MKVSVSGVRGVFPNDLNIEHVIAYVRAFSYIALDNSCVLAYDARTSSKLISKVASAVLRSKGLDVYNFGIMPTPVLVRESREHKDIGIMVTASHNPLNWNGIKFITNGRCIFDEELKEILARVNESKESTVMHNNGNNKSNNIGIGREYIIHNTNYIRDSIQFINDNINGVDDVAARPRVVIDTSIGTVKRYIQEILSNIGFKDIVVIDSNEPDPTVRSLTELKMLTSSNGIGFAFDSDADRLVVINQGKVLSPDDTLLLCIAPIISNRGYDSITVSVDTSNSIRDLARSYNCKIYYAKVGEANVVKSMLNNNSVIGGEGSSAGFIISNFNSCRDAILASMLILKAYDHIDKILEYSRYHTKRGKVSISTDIDVNKVIESIVSKEHDYSEYISIDGTKFIIDEYTWVLVRGSNTEHAIRLSVESINKDKTNTLYKIYEDKIVEACKDARREGYN
jgi:Phosphomannomutase